MFRVLSEANIDYKENVRFQNPIRKSFGDPFFDNVVLYLRGDGVNNSTNIIDSSPSPKTITLSGSPIISTAQSKYNGSSIYFNGSSLLSVADRADLPSSTQDFTLEYWIYPTSLSGYILGKGDAATVAGSTFAFIVSGGKVVYYNGSASGDPAGTMTINTWQHFAMVRNGTGVKSYVNGTLASSITLGGAATINDTPGALQIGGYASLTKFTGYLDSFRFTHAAARYTANFNPETDTFLDL